MEKKDRTLLVVNPVSGHGRGRKVFGRMEPALREAFPGLEVRVSEFPGQAFQFGREAVRDRYGRVLCLGGDGTPFEVVNGMYLQGRPPFLPEIGIIPSGTGNSFLLEFGIQTPEEALRRIAAGRSHRLGQGGVHRLGDGVLLVRPVEDDSPLRLSALYDDAGSGVPAASCWSSRPQRILQEEAAV